jgi:hypothetical protein
MAGSELVTREKTHVLRVEPTFSMMRSWPRVAPSRKAVVSNRV